MNPVALITGASRGIGRGIALALAGIGYDIAVNFVANEEAAGQTAREADAVAREKGHRIQAHVFRANVALGSDRRALLEGVQETFGRLDLLVNNAGVAPAERVDLLEATEASFDQTFGINLKGPYFLTQLAARWMIQQVAALRDAAERRPKIISISSISAYTASVNRGEYCIAKAALSMLTPLFAARLSEYGINVYEIRPGLIATDMTAPVKARYDTMIKEGLTPIARWGTPADVGRAVIAIAQDLLPFSTGEVINVDGGFHLRRL